MKDEDKISIMNRVIEMISQQSQGEDVPVMVGTLNGRIGINGFVPAEIGHPVFEFKDRYIIYLESETPDKISVAGKELEYRNFKISVPYYKPTLSDKITFR